MADVLKTYIFEAVEVERAGLKVTPPPPSAMPYPAELDAKISADSAFRAAWNALTPGRQRGYLLHFTSAKQSATRIARIDKCTDKILMGQGMQE